MTELNKLNMRPPPTVRMINRRNLEKLCELCPAQAEEFRARYRQITHAEALELIAEFEAQAKAEAKAEISMRTNRQSDAQVAAELREMLERERRYIAEQQERQRRQDYLDFWVEKRNLAEAEMREISEYERNPIEYGLRNE